MIQNLMYDLLGFPAFFAFYGVII